MRQWAWTVDLSLEMNMDNNVDENLNQNKNPYKKTLYDAPVFIFVLIALALFIGFVKSCNRGFERKDLLNLIDVHQDIQNSNPLVLSNKKREIYKLEGSPLSLTVPFNIFRYQGDLVCDSVVYEWSYLSKVKNAQMVQLSNQKSYLIFDRITIEDQGWYYIEARCNGQSYKLGPLVLNVVPKLQLESSSLSAQSVSLGSRLNLTSQFTGPTQITYQWFYSPKGEGRGSNNQFALKNETNANFYIDAVDLSDAGDYELVASSFEGGILQTIATGPVSIRIVPTKTISGNLFGSKNVRVGEPLQISSRVLGVSKPDYQWFLNDALVSGAGDPSYELPRAQISDAGVYTLVVNENGKKALVGSIQVSVICPPGEIPVDGKCRLEHKICVVNNGGGLQQYISKEKSGSCNVVVCNPGYINEDNSCVPVKKTCDVANGYGAFTENIKTSVEVCQVSHCEKGYVNINNSCQPRQCAVSNGFGLIHNNDGRLTCDLQYCNLKYTKLNNVCRPKVESCQVKNGRGQKENLENGFGQCRVTSCSTGYVNIQNSCMRRDCEVANGSGVITLSPNGAIQCRVVSCKSGHFLSNNQCISQVCQTGEGSGFWLEENNKRVCKINKCNDPDAHIENNKCKRSDCRLPNGRGFLASDSSGEESCVPQSCEDAYTMNNKSCVRSSERKCRVKNGAGFLSLDEKSCQINSCKPDYVFYQGECVKRFQVCSVANGKGEQRFTYNGPETCSIVRCDKGYIHQGNRCVARTQSCTIENGKGYSSSYSSGSSPCRVKSCDKGYGATLSEECLPIERPCVLGLGQGNQYLTSSGYGECKLETCPGGTNMILGKCVPEDKVYCEPMSKRKSARRARAVGKLYSLPKGKTYLNFRDMTKTPLRIEGDLFLEGLYFNSTGVLYEKSGDAIKHHEGGELKNKFALELQTQLLPPDGKFSGNYQLALASDDGAVLEAFINGAWKVVVDNKLGSSCEDIEVGLAPLRVSKKEPLSLKLTYFKGLGERQCLKLFYKKEGSRRSFKSVRSLRLKLPRQTDNLCAD